MSFLLPENLSPHLYITTSPFFPKQDHQLFTELWMNGDSLLICKLRNKLVNHRFEVIVGKQAQLMLTRSDSTGAEEWRQLPPWWEWHRETWGM